ncbi:MAG: FecR domain-containing protein [Limisphaerales bacterium]
MNYSPTTKGLLGGMLAAAVLALPVLAAMSQQKAKVVSFTGTATASESGGAATFSQVARGQVLPAGATLKTGASSTMDIDLGPVGSTVRLRESTTMSLAALMSESTPAGVESTTELDLSQGTIAGSVRKLGAVSKYQVKTPRATFGIRGTRFEISADGRASISEGSAIAIAQRPDGSTVTRVINAGESFDPGTGLVTGSGRAAEAAAPTGDVEATPFVNVGDPILRLTDTPISRVSPADGSAPAGDGGSND